MNEKFLKTLYDLADLVARYSIIERFHFIQESGLSQSQMMSLFHLNHNPDITLSALANYLGISNPAVSQLIEKLVRSELVIRIDNPSDRRRKLLELTDDGKKMVSQAKIAHHQWIQSLAETIEPEEIPAIEKAILTILEKHSLIYPCEKHSYHKGEN